MSFKSRICKHLSEPFFWRNVKRVISQNKKGGLENFLFPKNTDLEINRLKNKVEHLETKLGSKNLNRYQDPKIPPNVFDTRQTFLKKMEDKEMREKFLENYNRLNPIKEN